MYVGTYSLRHSWGSLFPSAAAELQGTTIKKKRDFIKEVHQCLIVNHAQVIRLCPETY